MEQATQTTQSTQNADSASSEAIKTSEVPQQTTENQQPAATSATGEEPKKQASPWMKRTLIILGILIVLGGVAYWIFG